MEIREIRVGNYYQWYADGKYYNYQIEAKDFANDNYKNFEPIKLTEEWLVKLGFTDEGDFFMNELQKDLVIYYDEGKVQIGSDFGTVESNLNHIHYVHQLQNLYSALTGTELETK